MPNAQKQSMQEKVTLYPPSRDSNTHCQWTAIIHVMGKQMIYVNALAHILYNETLDSFLLFVINGYKDVMSIY